MKKFIVIETTNEGFGQKSERVASRHATWSAAEKAAVKLRLWHLDQRHLMGAYATTVDRSN